MTIHLTQTAKRNEKKQYQKAIEHHTKQLAISKDLDDIIVYLFD